MDTLQLREYFNDCVKNAKAEGLDDESILLALMDELTWVIVNMKMKLYSERRTEDAT